MKLSTTQQIKCLCKKNSYITALAMPAEERSLQTMMIQNKRKHRKKAFTHT